MSVAGVLRRRLRDRQRSDWRTAVGAYLARPADFWDPGAPRHADKLEAKKHALCERDGLRDDEVVDEVVSMAAKRRTQRPAPVYVTGLGGSGSHWVTGMLNDLDGLVAAGEVYFPPRLLEQLRDHDTADQACAIDAVHLIHGWPRTGDVWAASIVNCAAGVQRLRLYKQWDAGAVGVHLVRDPRDQVLSVTFRKPGFRRYEDPEASDTEYLERMARRNAASHRQSRTAVGLVDITCRYEDLCDDPRPLLRAVSAALGRTVGDAVLERVAVRHDAATIRAGTGATGTNLDEGGRARTWRTATDPAQRRMLHTHLVDAVHGLGYPPGDCMGTPLPEHDLRARTLRFASGPPGPLYQRTGDDWTLLHHGDHGVEVPAGTPVLLRVAAGSPGLRALQRCQADDLQALCVAANTDVDDDALRHLGTLGGLRTLDLARTRISDAGLAHLEALTGLQQVHLAGTDTTAEGRSRLAGRMSQLTIWV